MSKLGTKFFFGSVLKKDKTIFEDKVFWASEYPKEFTEKQIVEGVNKGYEAIRGEVFDLIWDSTDHFNFLCNCGAIPNVVTVRFGIIEKKPTLYFSLFCQECGRSGQRKIYCNDIKELQMGMKVAKKTMVYNKVLECTRCKNKWIKRYNKTPKFCPKCKSPYWNKPRGGKLKYKWECRKCSKLIETNSKNTLILAKAQHLKKHEIKGY